jgi:hypothetical protein
MNSAFAFLLVVELMAGLIFAVLPKVSRPGLYFAVTVPETFPSSPPGIRILRRFRAGVLLVTLAPAAALFGLGPTRAAAGVVGFLLILAQVLALTAVFLFARHATLPHAIEPETPREGPAEARPPIIPGGTAVMVGPLILMALFALAAAVFWNHIPSRIPVHWGLSGPNRWIGRTSGSIAIFFLSNSGILALLLFMAFGLTRAVGRIARTGESGRAEIRFRHVSILVLVTVSYLIALQTPILLFVSTEPWAATVMNLIGAVILLTVVAGVTALFRMGQGGSRLPKRERGPLGDRRADRLWKWGLFYVNPDDPAFFVEKRFGLGYTINFGNRWTWVILAAIVLLIVASLVILR